MLDIVRGSEHGSFKREVTYVNEFYAWLLFSRERYSPRNNNDEQFVTSIDVY